MGFAFGFFSFIGWSCIFGLTIKFLVTKSCVCMGGGGVAGGCLCGEWGFR